MHDQQILLEICCMGVNDAEFAPTRFSTDDVPKRDRLQRWREEFRRVMVRVDIEPLSPELPYREPRRISMRVNPFVQQTASRR